jgi:hypothetical protein
VAIIAVIVILSAATLQTYYAAAPALKPQALEAGFYELTSHMQAWI